MAGSSDFVADSSMHIARFEGDASQLLTKPVSLIARARPLAQSKETYLDLHPKQLQGLSSKLASWTPPAASRLGRSFVSQSPTQAKPCCFASNQKDGVLATQPCPNALPSKQDGAPVSARRVAARILSRGCDVDTSASSSILFHQSPQPKTLHPRLLVEQQQHLHHKLQLIKSRKSLDSPSSRLQTSSTTCPVGHLDHQSPSALPGVACHRSSIKQRTHAGQVARRILTKGLYISPEPMSAVEVHPSCLSREPQALRSKSPLGKASSAALEDSLLLTLGGWVLV